MLPYLFQVLEAVIQIHDIDRPSTLSNSNIKMIFTLLKQIEDLIDLKNFGKIDTNPTRPIKGKMITGSLRCFKSAFVTTYLVSSKAERMRLE